MALEDRTFAGHQGRLEDIKLVRIDRPLHHILAEPVSGIDEDDIAEAGFGVEREHHTGAGDVGAHHFLHSNRKRHLRVVKPLMHAIGNRTVIEQRGENATTDAQQIFRATDIEEGVLLAGKGGVGEVLGRGRTAHRHIRLRPILPRQVRVRRRDFPGQVRRHVGVEYPAANVGAGLFQLCEVVRIDTLQARLDAFGEAIVFEIMPIGLRGGGKAVGYPHTLGAQVAEHLAQRSILPADHGDVVHSQFGKCADITHAWITK